MFSRPEIGDTGPAFTFPPKGGDLLELQTAENVEDEHLPLDLLQPQHRPADPAGLLPSEHSLLRRKCGVLQRQLLVGGVGVSAPPAAFLQPGILSDAAQPGVEAAAALEAVDVEERLIKCLLQQLLRLMLVPGQGQEEPVDRLSLGFVQLFKSGHGHSSLPIMP